MRKRLLGPCGLLGASRPEMTGRRRRGAAGEPVADSATWAGWVRPRWRLTPAPRPGGLGAPGVVGLLTPRSSSAQLEETAG